MTEPENRRRSERTPLELRVEYRRLNAFLADYTKNISKGGSFIRTDKPMPIGTRFAFSLVVPGFPEPLGLTGTVVWCVDEKDASAANPAGMGIEFAYEDDSERERVDAVIRSVMVKQLGASLTSKLLNDP